MNSNVFVRNQGTREFLEKLWKAWSSCFPHLARAYIQELKFEREQRRNSNGMSQDKTMAQVCKIPAAIYFVVTARYPNFFNDARNAHLAQEIFMGDYKPK